MMEHTLFALALITGGGPFRFYLWSGTGTEPERILVDDLGDYHPEAVIIYPDKGLREIQVLSDDGKHEVDDISNRDLPMGQRIVRFLDSAIKEPVKGRWCKCEGTATDAKTASNLDFSACLLKYRYDETYI